VVAVLGKPATQLATVSPAQSPPGKKAKDKDAERPLLSSTKDKALRAILRAPVEIQDLYREELADHTLPVTASKLIRSLS
jgi:hypothetical protein